MERDLNRYKATDRDRRTFIPCCKKQRRVKFKISGRSGKTCMIILAAILSFANSYPQQETSFAQTDSITYVLYTEGRWKELVREGEAAIRSGMDYFYLRMRTGIAAYERSDYSRAIRHFEKALQFNSADPVAKEYLYYSYLFYGRDTEADRVAEGFPQTLKEKTGYEGRGGVSSFSINATGSFIDDPGVADNFTIDQDPLTDGFQTIPRNFKHIGATLVHDGGGFTSINHSAGYLAKNYMLYQQEGGQSNLTGENRLTQFQYYLSARILVAEGTYLTPAAHYVNVIIPYYTTITGFSGGTTMTTEYSFQHNFAGSVTLEKYFGKVRPALSAGYSDINGNRQLQGSFQIHLFPGGNLNLYFLTGITGYTPLEIDQRDIKSVFSQTVGFRAFPGLWLEVRVMDGEIENFAGYKSYIIYNDRTIINRQYGLSLIAPFIGTGPEISLHYTFSNAESSFISEGDEAPHYSNSKQFNNHKITGGLKWKF